MCDKLEQGKAIIDELLEFSFKIKFFILGTHSSDLIFSSFFK